MIPRRFIFLTLFFLFALSCSKENIIIRNTVDIGSITPYRFVTDAGMVMNIVENHSGSEIRTLERAVVLFDILRKISNSEYDIRVLDIVEPKKKDIALLSESDPEALGNDPIFLRSGWFSGGYVNIEVLFKMHRESPGKHLVNLVYDDTADNSDTLHFSLKHNGYGEVPDLNKALEEQNEFVNGRAFMTFPIKDNLPGLESNMPVSVSYSWYDYPADGTLPGKIRSYSRSGMI